MTKEEIRAFMDSEIDEPIKYVPGTDLESVEPTREDLLWQFAGYDFLINQERNAREAEDARGGRFWRNIQALLDTGRYEAVSEAVDVYLAMPADSPLYKKLGYGTAEEAVSDIAKSIFDTAEHFIDTREPLLREAMLPYIESMLIAGIKAKFLLCVWLRANGYGFSVEPFDWEDGKEYGREDMKDFPYSSVSEMPKKDREAFQKTALDVYYEIQSHASLYQIKRLEGKPIEEEEEKSIDFKPYPKEGLSKKELVKLHRAGYLEENGVEDASEDEIFSSLFDSWETEIEPYLPILLHRYEEAVYYGLKYVGSEYIDYLKSLNVAEDWDAGLWDCEDEGKDVSYSKLFEVC